MPANWTNPDTKTCKDCGKTKKITEFEVIRGRFYRPSTKENIWLCKTCRPKNPRTITEEKIHEEREKR